MKNVHTEAGEAGKGSQSFYGGFDRGNITVWVTGTSCSRECLSVL